MPKINVKYKCGDRVRINHTRPTAGIVTAIFIRGKGRSYEVSHTDDKGPCHSICEEVELEPCGLNKKLGF